MSSFIDDLISWWIFSKLLFTSFLIIDWFLRIIFSLPSIPSLNIIKLSLVKWERSFRICTLVLIQYSFSSIDSISFLFSFKRISCIDIFSRVPLLVFRSYFWETECQWVLSLQLYPHTFSVHPRGFHPLPVLGTVVSKSAFRKLMISWRVWMRLNQTIGLAYCVSKFLIWETPDHI
ncbi:MAG: hypothetical protein Ta2E_11090 [Mycoplasmoidaceae bacterium]|nr:MAG: hypothetical protein Ta2E_11090 [Mycoplasmoidaceae bacterium]